MNSTDVTIGARLSGAVATVQQFYATVELDGQLGMAVIHISQLTDAFLAPPISAHLSIGDRLSGVIVGVDGKTGYPELSPKKLHRVDVQQRTVAAGKVEDCKVSKSNELYVLVETPNGPGLLVNRPEPWSRYEVLFASGLLSEGQRLALISTNQRDNSGRRKMRFPIYPVAKELIADALLDGEIALWRPNATRKKDEMLRNIIYVHVASGYIVRVECNDLLDISEHFSIGEMVQVRLSDRRPLRGIPFGTLQPGDGKQSKSPHSIHLGEQITGKVVRLLPGGAVVLIADHCWVYLPANSVLPGKGFIGTVLQCGDVVEGVVTEISETGDKDYGRSGIISFGRLVGPSTVSRQDRDTLIDLTTEKKAAVRGGFARHSAFRLAVLEANAHTCCFCGQNFSVGGATAMEAAHIVPRGKRGADSVSNGLCLCPVHHWAFDRGLWGLDASMVIRVASTIRHQVKSSADWLVDFHGKPATFPLEPRMSMEALDWHRRNVFLDADDMGDIVL